MKVFFNGKTFSLSMVLCWTISVLVGPPVGGQEKPADAPSTDEDSSSSAAEAPELTEEAEKAIERGLKFLISNQNKDGSWSSNDLEKEASGGYPMILKIGARVTRSPAPVSD